MNPPTPPGPWAVAATLVHFALGGAGLAFLLFSDRPDVAAALTALSLAVLWALLYESARDRTDP